MKRCLLTIGFLLLLKAVYAQVFIARNFFPDPLQDTTAEKGIMANTFFAAEGKRGYGSTGGELAYDVKYLGMVELYRFNKNTTLALMLSNEFTANPHNEINFHMRGTIWNENFALFHKMKHFTLEGGLTHHCRHEIDNSIPPDESDPVETHEPTRRLIVLTCPYVAINSGWKSIHKNAAIKGYARLNYYTYNEDSRRPRDEADYTQLWDHLRASALIGFRAYWQLNPDIQIFTRNWTNPAYFTEDEPWKANHRLEAGIGISGNRANLEIFCGWEQWFDDVTRHFPRKSTVVDFGIRGRPEALF